ncbi:Protein kinase domain-containing protein [Psidium guajava]|nr:Protein kinase domain-containing protein [Psidium guajava]
MISSTPSNVPSNDSSDPPPDASLPTPPPLDTSPLVPDLPSDDEPIALRKGIRACRNRPVYNDSYKGLSVQTQAPWFRMRLGSWFLFPLVSKLLVVNGFIVSRLIQMARLKARLVAKGYAQQYGVDYFETFSPVAKMASVRLFISLASSHDWILHQLDVKNAFLNGYLDEEVYMEQPPGFVAQGESSKVCRLRRSLYGLKQSPRAWFGRFTTAVVRDFGMKQSIKDSSVFYHTSPTGCIYMVVYVDDIVITGSDLAGISRLKEFLHSQFQTKDLGPLGYFLGIEDTGLSGAKYCESPMLPGDKLMPQEGSPIPEPERYRRLVGKLNYLTMTRPDVAFLVSVVSQFMADPRVPHWEAALRIVKYLKKDPGKGVIYQNHGHSRIEAFCDADWAGSPADRRSTSGFTIFMGGNLVSWKSKKQDVVARSSCEAEYRSMASTTAEIMWLQQLLTEIGYSIDCPSKLWCDNQSALHIRDNPVFHERTKHIEVDCHFVRDALLRNVIEFGYIRTSDQLADILTKSTTGKRIEFICNKLGMMNIYAPA